MRHRRIVLTLLPLAVATVAFVVALLGSISIVDRYTVDATAAAAQPADLQLRDGQLALLLKDRSRLIGAPVGNPKLTLRCVVGDVEILLDKVAGIQTDAADPNGSVVLFANGDRLTGKLSGEAIRFKTSWGEVSVKLEDLDLVATGHVSIYEELLTEDVPGGGRVERRVQRLALRSAGPPRRVVRDLKTEYKTDYSPYKTAYPPRHFEKTPILKTQ